MGHGEHEMKKEKIIEKILKFCDREDVAVVSRAYEDGGAAPPFARLRRAALNQISSGDAVFSRYAIWANTLRDNVRQAMDLQEQGRYNEAKRLLIRTVNSLSAFAEIQVVCDPMGIGRQTIGVDGSDDDSSF